MDLIKMKQSLSKKIQKIKSQIASIDKILDDENISNEQFEKLSIDAANLTQEMGEIQRQLDFINVVHIDKVNEWTNSFLLSFSSGTRKITNRQAECFTKINHNKPFIYNGRRYDCSEANYRLGFASLTITNI